jgi:glycosyltransferase involved in cell wall biosynthesis
MMFALAANGFNKPSETFIRAHARGIAPGNTLLIAERRETKRPIDAPLILFSKRMPIYSGRSQGALQILAGVLSPAWLFQSRNQYLAGLLRRSGVTTMMVEYGSCAVHLVEAANMADCRFFVHFHGVDASKALRDPATVDRYQKMFATADGIIAPSKFIAQNLKGVGCPAEKLHVVPCGVDITKITAGQPSGQNLLSVGRFTQKKAPLTTIAAFAIVKKTWNDATLTMLGDGPLLDDAKAQVKALDLEDSVVLPGMVTAAEVHAAMQKSCAFLQHSVTADNGDIEGLPVAILEAMAAELPVVSTLHSGIPEAVSDGETGFLVNEGDVDAMAANVMTLLADPDLARSFGRAGRAKVENEFTIDATIARLQGIMGL